MTHPIGRRRHSNVWHLTRPPRRGEGPNEPDRATWRLSLCSLVWRIQERRIGTPTCKMCRKAAPPDTARPVEPCLPSGETDSNNGGSMTETNDTPDEIILTREEAELAALYLEGNGETSRDAEAEAVAGSIRAKL